MEKNEILLEMNVKLTKIDANLEKIVDPNGWINLREAAQYSGLSESTIRRAVRRGSLKCSRRPGKRLFKRSDIDRWLNDK